MSPAEQFAEAGWEELSPGLWVNRQNIKSTVYCGPCSGLRRITSSVACDSRSFNGDLEWYKAQGARPRRAELACGHYVTYVARAQ